MAGIRTFIAIELPLSAKQVCVRAQQELVHLLEPAGLARAVRWSAPGKIHLTLRFLGDTAPDQVNLLDNRLAMVASRTRPFVLTIGSLGCFPNQRTPSVLWMGLQGDLAALHALQVQVESAAVDAGFSPDRKEYRPHLTLGRVGRRVNRADVRRLGTLLDPDPLRVQADDAALAFSVCDIVLMESKLQPDGALYLVLSRVALTNAE